MKKDRQRMGAAAALAIACSLLAAAPARAQSAAELRKEIDELKARLERLEAVAKSLDEAGGPIEKAEFNRVKTKVEAAEDAHEASGFGDLRISAGIDPAYIYSAAKDRGSFSFLNNFTDIGGSAEWYSYDNSYFGLAWIDFSKELEGGTALRLTLAPSKSAASGYNVGNIVHEATASIPLGSPDTRLLVGQIPDFSGYESFFATNAWNVGANQGHAITHSLLFDFAAATFYTGAGLDLTRGNWNTKFVLGNFNSARNDPASGLSGSGIRSPAFIYNATWTPSEFHTLEFTGYEASAPTISGGRGRVDQFEIDGAILRGAHSTYLQLVTGRQRGGAFNGGDSSWLGASLTHACRFTPRFEGSLRLDYLRNSKNGGGTYNLASLDPGGNDYVGDFVNGFGPGDPDASNYDPDRGANRSAITFALGYDWSLNVAFRAEYRLDYADRPSFYYFGDGSYRKSNRVFGLQAVVSF